MWKVWVLPLLLCACELPPSTSTSDGGASDGGVAVDAGTGSLSGPLAFTVTQSFEIHPLDTQGNPLGYGADLVDYDLSCAQLQAGDKPAGFQQVEVGVLGTQGNPDPAAGTYQVLNTPTLGSAYVRWGRLLADGGTIGPIFAQDGTVTLSVSTADHLTGTFQVDIADFNGQVGQLTGDFDAPFCP